MKPWVGVRGVVLAGYDSSQRVEVRRAAAAVGGVASVGAGQEGLGVGPGAAVFGYKGCFLVGRGVFHCGGVRVGRGVAVGVPAVTRVVVVLFACAPAGVDGVVVGALGDEDQVGDTKVHAESDRGGGEGSPERAREVGNVTEEPDEEEFHGQRVGRFGLVICD